MCSTSFVGSRDPEEAGGWGSRGGQGGAKGVKGGQGGYLENSKTGSNTQMAVCRGWGVYICTYVTHVHMYVHF